MDHIGADDLAHLLKELHQGDIVDVGKLVFLYSPDTPTWPHEVEDVPHEEPVMTMEVRLSPRFAVIITQDCDLRRGLETEPYVLLSPLRQVSQEDYDRAVRGLTPRAFAYPDVGEHDRLVVDLRAVSSLEKTALLSSHVDRIPCPLSEPRRTAFRELLGDRFGRTPFPDEIERQVITPITQSVTRMSENANGAGVLAATTFVGLRWMPGKRYVSLLLLVDSAKLAQYKLRQENVEAGLNALRKALQHFGRNSDYTIVANAHDATQVSAAELLSHEELQLDLDQVDMEMIAERAAQERAEVGADE